MTTYKPQLRIFIDGQPETVRPVSGDQRDTRTHDYYQVVRNGQPVSEFSLPWHFRDGCSGSLTTGGHTYSWNGF